MSVQAGKKRNKGTLHSPLVNKDELAINGVPGDVLGGLHPDVGQAGLGDDVGVQAADGHQAAQVAAFVVGLVVLVQAHFGRRPTLQVARAVDRAEALAVSCESGGREREREGQDYETGLDCSVTFAVAIKIGL